jgi:hypothetical protein
VLRWQLILGEKIVDWKSGKRPWFILKNDSKKFCDGSRCTQRDRIVGTLFVQTTNRENGNLSLLEMVAVSHRATRCRVCGFLKNTDSIAFLS